MNFLTLVSGILILALVHGHDFAPKPDRHELLVPPKNMKAFALGYGEVLADTLWLRVIQDFDSCGKSTRVGVAPVPEGADAVNKQLSQRIGRCESSWVFNMIDAITELAPNFRTAYSSGGVILSVAVDDISGAARIYAKASERFPDDWQIAYKAAYHYLYEMGDRQKAADMLVIAARSPQSPRWIPVLTARLYSKTGSAMLGQAVLQDFLEKNPDLAENEHIKERRREIERDLAAGDDPAPTPAPEFLKQPTQLPQKKQ